MTDRAILIAVARADLWLCAAWQYVRAAALLLIAAAILKGVVHK